MDQFSLMQTQQNLQQQYWDQMSQLNQYAQMVNQTPFDSNPMGQALSFVPRELEEEVQPIQGDPKGAKWMVSYMFKKPIDPVVFIKTEKEMKAFVASLLEDPKVDHKSIIVHKISVQYVPTESWVKKMMKVKKTTFKKLKVKK